ncbi:vacuolar protein sorting family 37 protein [Pseudozobellia thermophila]|uniref:Uncharacterized protein n=1 Tax=Pseudozobellia thermophila TaxID=192903 RepID=A0A1M6JU81_9FLAO|nr:TMF family protein [Pseudozobellia thermophila]SHJ50257.1 hypothetical protein SAMN04488513_105153 [Pseudozobellia thermophila]
MLKHYALPFLLIGLLLTTVTQAQVKIGDDPQTIDPASILELQSSDKVLVITRVDEAQMASIAPSRGALVYNTTAGCVFYYDGVQWINLCEAGSAGNLTADAIVNAESTIVITPTADGANFEVAPGSINSEQIVDGGINGIDIQDGSIGPGKLQDGSVTQDKLSENSVGAYALDNDNINLSDFTNDEGFITGADVVSPDPNNSITPDANGAAFFNAQPLQDGIDNNAAAIAAAVAADGDTDATNELQDITLVGDQLTISGGSTVTIPTADGSDTKIIDGTNTTVSGAGTDISPYAINVTPDGDGDSSNELITSAVLNASNVLVITEGGVDTPVDLSPLAGGGDDNQTAAEVPAAATATNYTPTSADVEGHLEGIDAALATATTPNLSTVLGEGNDAGTEVISNLGDPTAAQDAATKQYVDDEITASKALTDGNILVGDASNEAQEVVMSGDATIDNTGVLTIEDEAVTSDKIANATIQLEDLSDMGATSNGEIIQWDTSANSGAGGWTIANNSGGHSGTAKAIFFANADGTPTTADDNDNPNDDFGLIWDTEGRPVGSNTYGALYVGRKGDSPTPGNYAKVVISERIPNGHVQAGLAYPLQLQNESGQVGSSSGILFAVDRGGSHGKGALVYERQDAWGVGDFHFLQNTDNTGNAIPDIADKAFTIKNNKDIQLYGNLIARNGAGSDGQVLMTNAAGETVWGTGGGGLSAVTVTAGSFTGDGTSGSALDIADNAIGTTELADNAVNADKIADDAVGSAELADNAVTTASINAGAVTSEKIANNTILAEDLSDMGATTNGQVLKWNGTAWAPGTDDTSSTPYTAGDGLSLATNEFSVNVDDTTIGISGTDQLEVKDDGITTAKIKESPTDGQVLTTSGGDVVWADPVNLENNDVILDEERTIDLNGNNLIIDGSGSVGIGTDTPDGKLHVIGIIRTQGIRNSSGTAGVPAYRFTDNGDTGMFLADNSGVLGFSANNIEAMRIDDSQNVGIGPNFDSNPIGARLHVDGNIWADGEVRASGILIPSDSGPVVPDYVFQKYFLGSSDLKEDYSFSSLEEIEAFIKQNHHLPGVTSAVKAKEEGHWNLSESNLQNLEKIEELFLYTIEQEKEIEKLRAENESMAQELESIKKDLEAIKALLNQ